MTDQAGRNGRASISAVVANLPPGVVGRVVGLRAGYAAFLGSVIDPEEGLLCGRQYCSLASASGACGPSAAIVDCTCLAGVEVDVTTALTGTCTLNITVRDSWGLAGTTAITFDVAHP